MPLTVKDFQVAWICAIQTEYVVASQLLDAEFLEGPDGLDSTDENVYTFGRVGLHNVVIACLPKGKYGLTSAASVAKDVTRTFPSIRYRLMVGIAGGAPSSKHDIRLGDVVVSTPSERDSGVVNYRYGRMKQDQPFQRTGSLRGPSRILLSALQKLATLHELNGHHIQQTISQMLNRNRRLRKKYAMPDPQSDVLFDASFLHADSGEPCMHSCVELGRIVKRKPRDPTADHPVIHYGLVASADVLMNDAIMRDYIAKEEQILCFEMEAAGLMDHFQCVVIRGICDYSDTHKNDVWQGYAAATAAAYAREMLGVLPHSGAATQTIRVNPAAKGHQQVDDTEREHQFLRQKLHTVNYQSLLTDVMRPFPGTCQWLLQHESFLRWLKKGPGIFWLYGLSGYGKSVLARKVVEALASDLNSTAKERVVLHYFFRATDASYGLQVSCLQSLLHQLLVAFPALTAIIFNALYKKSATHSMKIDDLSYGNTDSLWEAMTDSLFSHIIGDVIIVLDALDEAGHGELRAILTQLDVIVGRCFKTTNFGSNAPCRVQVFATSRPNRLVQQVFNRHYVVAMELSGSTTEKDVGLFFERKVGAFTDEHGIPSDVAMRIEKHLIDRAQGMFLWAVLAWESFTSGQVFWSCKVVDERLAALEDLPPGLDQLYMTLMFRTGAKIMPEAHTMFAVMTAAARALTFDELGFLIAMKPENANASEVELPFSMEKAIKGTFSTLFKISARGTVTFYHHSLGEWIRSKLLQVHHEELHARLAGLCLQYLTLNDVKRTATLDSRQSGTTYCLLDDKFVLYDYAASFLKYHLEKAPATDPGWIKYSFLPRVYQDAFPACVRSYHPIHVKDFSGPGYFEETPLRHVLRLRMLDLANTFVRSGYDINELVRGSTALLSYVRDHSNELDTISKLLEMGADPNVCDERGRSVLHWAISNRCHSVVEKLLHIPDINVNIQDARGQTALHLEAISSDDELILLRDPRVDPKIKDREGRDALTYAFSWGYRRVASQFIGLNAFAVSQEQEGLSPFIAAAAQQWREITLELIPKISAIDNHRGHDGRGVLHWAVFNDWPDVLSFALAVGAKPNIMDNHGSTPLHYAAEFGNPKAARQLLRHGASAQLEDVNGQLPVHIAARHGYQDTVHPLIVDSDFDVNQTDQQRRTLLHWVASHDWVSILRLVLDLPEVDIHKRDCNGRTALHIAALCGCPNVMQFLIHLNAYDLWQVDAFGNSVLHLSARARNASTVKILLPFGWRHQQRINCWGQNALDVALVYAAEDVIRLFEAAGIRRQKASHLPTVATCQNTNYCEEKLYAKEDWALALNSRGYYLREERTLDRKRRKLPNQWARKPMYLRAERRRIREEIRSIRVMQEASSSVSEQLMVSDRLESGKITDEDRCTQIDTAEAN